MLPDVIELESSDKIFSALFPIRKKPAVKAGEKVLERGKAVNNKI